jgi:hypothetical protein
MPGTNQRNDAELATEGMTQPAPPTCTWRPNDAESLRIALAIPVSAPSLSALNREMALLQTHYPTGVCTAQGHLDAIADLDQQLAAGTLDAASSRALERRLRLGARIDDAYGEWLQRRRQPDAAGDPRLPELERQLRSPQAAAGHAVLAGPADNRSDPSAAPPSSPPLP